MRPEKNGRVGRIGDGRWEKDGAWLPSDDVFCLKAVQLLKKFSNIWIEMRPEEDGRGLVMDEKMEPGSHEMVVILT